MTDKGALVSQELKQKYDDYYNDGLEEWREIGARQKVENILKVCPEKRFSKVLEIGSGSGIILEKLSLVDFAKELYALDISSSSIEQIRKKKIKNLVEVEVFDGYSTKFKDKEFDLVVLSHVLEHAEHPRMLLREIKRIAKHLVIEVPRDYKPGVDKRWKALVDYGHINLYTPTLLRFLLKTEGFGLQQEHWSIISKELGRYSVRGKGKFAQLKNEVFLLIRDLVFPFVPKWRKETMINAYTVFCKNSVDS